MLSNPRVYTSPPPRGECDAFFSIESDYCCSGLLRKRTTRNEGRPFRLLRRNCGDKGAAALFVVRTDLGARRQHGAICLISPTHILRSTFRESGLLSNKSKNETKPGRFVENWFSVDQVIGWPQGRSETGAVDASSWCTSSSYLQQLLPSYSVVCSIFFFFRGDVRPLWRPFPVDPGPSGYIS